MHNRSHSGPKRWEVPLAVTLTLFVQTTVSLLAASVPVLAPEIATTRGWDPNLIAFYAPLGYLAGLVTMFQIPTLLRRFGGMGLSLVCVAFCGIGLLCLLRDSLDIILVVPLAIGAANGAVIPASSHILGPRISPRSAALVMSIKQTGVPLGGVLAGAVIPLLVLRMGWQEAVVLAACASAVIVAGLFPSVRWIDRAEKVSVLPKYRPLDPIRHLLAMPGMLKLLIAATTFVAMQICLRSFFTIYLVKDLGLDLATAGLIFSASQAAGIGGQIGWAAISDRLLGAHAVMAMIGVIMTASAVLSATFSPAWPTAALVAVAVLYGVSAAGFIPVMLGEVTRAAPPGQAGVLTSGSGAFLTAGLLLGPLIFGGVASTLGYPGAFLTLAACTLTGAIIVADNLRAYRAKTAVGREAMPAREPLTNPE